MNLRQIFASTGAFLAFLTICRSSQASNICNETVPSNRMVDGIPSYAQCTDSQSASIYSNNGVDTATSSGGTGWVRTQMSGGYQCTEFAHRYLYFKWNIQNVPNGNAGVWCDGTLPNGVVKSTTPIHGDLIVFAPGSCGADSTTGHVALVDVVNADSTVTIVEQNRAGTRKCQISCAACFLHVAANDGTPADGGTAPDAAPDANSSGDDAIAQADIPRRNDALPLADRPFFATGGTSGSGGASGTGGVSGSGGGSGSGGATNTTLSGGASGSSASGGTSGSGGVASSGGTSGVGGASGAGGRSGAGGAIGSGGAALADAAATGGAGGSTTTSTAMPKDSSSGCACRLAAAQRRDRDWTTVAVVLLIAFVLRPRRVARR